MVWLPARFLGADGTIVVTSSVSLFHSLKLQTWSWPSSFHPNINHCFTALISAHLSGLWRCGRKSVVFIIIIGCLKFLICGTAIKISWRWQRNIIFRTSASYFRLFYNVLLSMNLGKPYSWIHSASFIQNSCLSATLSLLGMVHMGKGQGPPLDEWLVHHSALWAFCGFCTLLKCTSAVLWQCSGTFPCYQNTFYVLSTLGLKPRTLWFSTDWATRAH